ncbi:MAG: ABC transporter permease [Chloroflexota bacterium]|nr:MAG: ABC transporter permease [Chloroflexota bacterium]
MTSTQSTVKPSSSLRTVIGQIWDVARLPVLALLTAFVVGALVIWVSNGSLLTVYDAYSGLIRGAFFKQRGFTETLVATVPYIFLSLAVAVGFKAGLFNIGVEGQFYVGAVAAAWAGSAVHNLPAIIHLPLALAAGAIGGGIWAAIPGYLKARTGAHEVITTIMLNYVSFRLAEYFVSGPLKDPFASAVQTPGVSREAELWTMYSIPERLQVFSNALAVGLVVAFVAAVIARWALKSTSLGEKYQDPNRRRMIYAGAGLLAGLIALFGLPPLTQLWWPFTDPYDRMHIGLFLGLAAAVFIWWLLWRTTLGFELRMVGANPNAARYAGVNITRNIVLAMAISGGLAGLAGTIEVLGVSICRCLPLFFSSGYGFDSIAIALLSKNDPFGIVASSFLFGAMRNGADLMELNSGVSKYIISLIQALALLFVAAPSVVRWIYRIRVSRKPLDEETTLTRSWGG